MRLRMLVVPAVLLAVALPAQARAGGFTGTVVAKVAHRGTLLLATAHGAGLTVRGGVARAAVGERVRVQGALLRDGTVRLARLQVLAHVRRASLRGTVLRTLARGTLLASGRSVVTIHRSARGLASAHDRHGLQTGEVVDVRIRFDDDDLIEVAPPSLVAPAGAARIEGSIVTVSPFVVALDGLPLTITLPAGVTLPATLAPGQAIELTVQVGTGNTFTLVAIDELVSANPPVEEQEVEVKGSVVSSTSSQIVVSANGMQFTFVAPPNTTLPVLVAGTFVEARGVRHNGVITLTRLRTDDDGGGGGHH